MTEWLFDALALLLILGGTVLYRALRPSGASGERFDRRARVVGAVALVAALVALALVLGPAMRGIGW